MADSDKPIPYGASQTEILPYSGKSAHRALARKAKACAVKLSGILRSYGVPRKEPLTPTELVCVAAYGRGILDWLDLYYDSLFPTAVGLDEKRLDHLMKDMHDFLVYDLYDKLKKELNFFRIGIDDYRPWAVCGIWGTKHMKAAFFIDECDRAVHKHGVEIAETAKLAARNLAKTLRVFFPDEIAPGARLTPDETRLLVTGALDNMDALYGAPECVMNSPVMKEEIMKVLREEAMRQFKAVEKTIEGIFRKENIILPEVI